jgi:uncharacterized protein CbrC (UPF0167 family)
MSNHVRDCPMSGSYSVTTCPCCHRRITPARYTRPRLTEQEIDEALRQRPPWPLFDVDGRCELDA